MSAEAASLHDELQQAVALYKEQIQGLQELIQQDPENTEAAQLHEELQSGLAAVELSLRELRSAGSSAAAAGADGLLDDPEQALPTTPAAAAAAATSAHLKPRTIPTSMHPENIYCQHEPDFLKLAEVHSPLKQYVTQLPNGHGSINFTSWEATRELTAALLKGDHGVHWTLPEGHLVPPVPNRLNYLHWVHSLLQLSSPPGQVCGLDVGCGASLIYCLLGAAAFGWHMTGLDVQPASLAAAQQLVDGNPHLQHLLEVRAAGSSSAQDASDPTAAAGTTAARPAAGRQAGGSRKVQGILLPAMQDADETFAFSMCNPPFFNSIQEANQNPATACGGTAEEMVYPGGELAFIRQMIADSRLLKGRIHWYTSMCGKKATLKTLRRELHDMGVTALRTTELAQGKTSRWAIAWSFAVDTSTAAQPLPMGVATATARQATGSATGPSSGSSSIADTGAPPEAPVDTWSGPNVRLVRQLLWTVQAPQAEGQKLLSAIAALLKTTGGTSRVDHAGWCVEASVPLQGVAAAAGEPPGQQQQQQLMGPPPPKRPKVAAAAAPAVAVRLRVQQEQRGCFAVQATIANSCGELEARCFMRAMGELKQDLALMWPVH